MGLKPTGEITALKIRGYFLCGAFLDLGFNDMMVLQQGVDQVPSCSSPRTCQSIRLRSCWLGSPLVHALLHVERRHWLRIASSLISSDPCKGRSRAGGV